MKPKKRILTLAVGFMLVGIFGFVAPAVGATLSYYSIYLNPCQNATIIRENLSHSGNYKRYYVSVDGNCAKGCNFWIRKQSDNNQIAYSTTVYPGYSSTAQYSTVVSCKVKLMGHEIQWGLLSDLVYGNYCIDYSTY